MSGHLTCCTAKNKVNMYIEIPCGGTPGCSIKTVNCILTIPLNCNNNNNVLCCSKSNYGAGMRNVVLNDA